ncbi:MAG: hypothetical protein V4631_20510, partial [Pseudomonadota bacterium]
MRALLLPLLLMVSAHAASAPTADELIARYGAAYRALEMGELALPYRDNIVNLVRETDLPFQKKLFTGVARDLQTVERAGLSDCQRLDLARIAFETDANLHKLAVLEQFAALGKQAVGSDVTPAELMKSGKLELASVLARYRALQARDGLCRQGPALPGPPEQCAIHVPAGNHAAGRLRGKATDRVRQPAQAVSGPWIE